MSRESLRTGEVAAKAGVNIQTLRYYERRGLLGEPERRPSGYRKYPTETVRLIRFIKRAQELGFTLAEIEELLRLRADQSSTCEAVRAAAEEKIADIAERIRSLQSMRRALGVLVASCVSEKSPRRCPMLEALEDREERRT